MTSDVHYCDWAQQPDIHLACRDSCTTPAWATEPNPSWPYTDAPGVYMADGGYRYTFERELVTCPGCNRLIAERGMRDG